jgi:predicted N-formylglutamate amidohydrolase
MWREDTRLAPPLIEALAKDTNYAVRSNEPYDFRTNDWFTLQRHGLDIGVPCAYIEIRNDLMGSASSLANDLAEAILHASRLLPGAAVQPGERS